MVDAINWKCISWILETNLYHCKIQRIGWRASSIAY